MQSSSTTFGGAVDGRFPRQTGLADGYAELEPAFTVPADLFTRLARSSPEQLQQDFLDCYETVSGEHVAVVEDTLFLPSASMAISVIGRRLAAEGVRRVGVPAPSFDSLPRLLSEAGLEPVPVPESDTQLIAAAAELDALYLVLPNNPSGWTPSDETLERVAGLARTRGCPVVIDRTCRFHQQRQYSHLFDLDFDWVDIQDTGKTWSTAGAKVSFVRCRSSLRLAALREDLDVHLRAVPAVNYWVATAAIRAEHGLERMQAAVRVNLEQLERSILGPLGFELVSQPLGVALLRLPPGCAMHSAHLAEKLGIAGFSVMPGREFYWADPEAGHAYLRLALVRPASAFRASVEALAEAIRSLI